MQRQEACLQLVEWKKKKDHTKAMYSFSYNLKYCKVSLRIRRARTITIGPKILRPRKWHLGDLKKSASDPPEKRQKKCLLETRTKIGLTDKNSGTNGQFLFRLGNFFVRWFIFCPLSHIFTVVLVAPI